MVTFLSRWNRPVSIWAIMAVDCPGARVFWRGQAVTQPQDTRTVLMVTGTPVLLVRRKGWTRSGPFGTEPKSRLTLSNMASAHEAARVGPAVHRPTTMTIEYRNMGTLPCCLEPLCPPGVTYRPN